MIVNYETLIPSIYQKCQEAILSGEPWELMANKTVFSVFKSELKSAFDATVLDFGGHNESYLSGKTMADLEKSTSSDSQRLHEDIKEHATNALKYLVGDIHNDIVKNVSYDDIKEKVLSSPVHFYVVPMLNSNSNSACYCFVCGKRSSYYMKDGTISAGCKIDSTSPYWENLDPIYKIMLRGESENDVKGSKCDYPKGIEQYEQYLTVKSNHLVFSNDLRNLFDIKPMESDEYITKKSGYHNNINSELGVMYEQEYMLKKGLMKIQVGNTSPIVAYNSSTGVIMAIDPNAWKSKKKYTFPISTDGFKLKGKICTDVWTVQAVDSIVFEKQAKENETTLEEAAARHGFLVPVTPGKYKITNYNAHHYSNRPVFFSIEKVG